MSSPFCGSARRATLCTVVVLACGFGTIVSTPLLADDTDEYRGQPLVEILRRLQDRGLQLIFSSAIVSENLRVSIEPTATEPRAMLDEILLPLGLKAEDGPSGAILILPASTETGSLSGRVVSLTGGKPVFGAIVRLPATDHAAISDADGLFQIRHIPVGRYEVLVEARGFSTTPLSRIRITSDVETEVSVQLRARPSFVTRPERPITTLTELINKFVEVIVNSITFLDQISIGTLQTILQGIVDTFELAQ